MKLKVVFKRVIKLKGLSVSKNEEVILLLVSPDISRGLLKSQRFTRVNDYLSVVFFCLILF